MQVFNLIISTPEGIFFEGDVKSVKAKTSFGQFQMFSNPGPYIASLRPCILTVVDREKNRSEYAISEGIIETKGDNVVLCVNSIISKDEIDLSKAEESMKRALERYNSKDYKIDKERAKNALDRAKAKVDLVK